MLGRAARDEIGFGGLLVLNPWIGFWNSSFIWWHTLLAVFFFRPKCLKHLQADGLSLTPLRAVFLAALTPFQESYEKIELRRNWCGAGTYDLHRTIFFVMQSSIR